MASSLRLAILLLSNPAPWMATSSRDDDTQELLSADDAEGEKHCCCPKAGKLFRTVSISEEVDEATKNNFGEDCTADLLFERFEGISCKTHSKELSKLVFPKVDAAIAEKAAPLGETLKQLNVDNLQNLRDALKAYKDGMAEEKKNFAEAVVSVQSEFGVLKDETLKLAEMKKFNAAMVSLESSIKLFEQKDFVESVTKLNPFKGRFHNQKGKSDNEDPKWKCCGYNNPKSKCDMYQRSCKIVPFMVNADSKLCAQPAA
mmetsp:Transcript_5652/g.7763  ORF Transcript_5652/g.7763 Transcript_5652/m.7763 type:complete len:259 (-) Transcript_5652:52-828(-)